jgi:hypothetical protein
MGQPAPPFVRFPCPLCLEALGREVTITAELDLRTPFVLLGSLSGCGHAEAFGPVRRLTLEQEWRLIGAALDAYESQPPEDPCR